mgnify:CR=1 FL=1
MIVFLFLFLKNGDFSEVEKIGYEFWEFENLDIEKEDSFLLFWTEEKGYLIQNAYNVKDPYVKIYYLNECYKFRFKVSILDEEKIAQRSLSLQVIEIVKFGTYDSLSFKLSFYNNEENCKIKFYKIESNFLKNLDLTNYKYKPKFWDIDKNKFWQVVQLKPGTIYKLSIFAKGHYKFQIDCIDYKENFRKLKDSIVFIDTISAYCFKQFFVFKIDSGQISQIKSEILGILDFVVSTKSKKIFIYKNVDYNGKILIYDKNGKLIKNENFSENPKIFEFDKRGKFLIIIPKKFKKEIKL